MPIYEQLRLLFPLQLSALRSGILVGLATNGNDSRFSVCNAKPTSMKTTSSIALHQSVSSRLLRAVVENLIWRVRPENCPEKTGVKVCGFKKSAYLCGVYHLNQATVSPSAPAAGLFYGRGLCHTHSSVPCGALMRPQPDSGGRQRGAELFLFPSPNIISTIVSF